MEIILRNKTTNPIINKMAVTIHPGDMSAVEAGDVKTMKRI